MTFLSVITRHMPQRAAMLKVNRASLDMQSCNSWQQHVIVDEIGQGWQHAAEMLVTGAMLAKGEYILILDDDDILLNADGIRQMKEAAITSRPAAVIFKGWHADLGILPGPNGWMRRPWLGSIGSFDFIIQRDLFCELAEAAVASQYNNDFAIIDGVFARKHTVVWLNTLMCAAMRRSKGQ